jgi:hypothetical protein
VPEQVRAGLVGAALHRIVCGTVTPQRNCLETRL